MEKLYREYLKKYDPLSRLKVVIFGIFHAKISPSLVQIVI
jgi:hypothetical protein